MNVSLVNDPEWLYEMYHERQLNSNEIAKLADCSGVTIRKYMHAFGISVRSRSTSIKLSWDNDPKRKEIMSEWSKENTPKYLKQHWQDPKYRKRMLKVLRDPELRKQHSEKMKERLEWMWQDPEYREFQSNMASENMTERWKDPKFRAMHDRRMRSENNPTWLGGVCDNPYDEQFDEEFKEYIRSLQDYQCFICGKRTRRKRKLDVHHIDYNKKNTTVENCVGLCKSCHTRTNFNRKHWLQWFEDQLMMMEIVDVV